MHETVDVRGIAIANVTMSQAVAIAKEHLSSVRPSPYTIFTPNAEILQMCVENPKIRSVISSADMCIPDGSGVLLAAKILKTPLQEKVAGVEFGEALFKLAESDQYRIFLLGAKPGIAEKAAETMKEKYPGACVCGTQDGYFNRENEENDRVIQKIKGAGTDILFVCLGAPAQEKWIIENREALNGVKLCVGLGGSLDVYAGNTKRAPKLFIKLHCEWLYRLLLQPSRIGRMLKLPKFVFGTIRYKFKKKF